MVAPVLPVVSEEWRAAPVLPMLSLGPVQAC